VPHPNASITRLIAGPGKPDTAEKPSTTGAELRRTYQTATGQLAEAFARILLRYYPGNKLLQVDLASGPGDTLIGFGPEMLGPFYAASGCLNGVEAKKGPACHIARDAPGKSAIRQVARPWRPAKKP
jgi:hypothetical protein